jgi:predicted house-cleaning NTP pyrophosphatase (Maf/HAM1 superfamily)
MSREICQNLPVFSLQMESHLIVRDKAGSYGIQDGKGGTFVRLIRGCFYNATGFPLNKFCREMHASVLPRLLSQ